MSLRHGARQLLTHIEADEAEALKLLDTAINRIKYNPDFAADQIRKAQDAIRRAQQRRRDELPDMLQKAAPPLERRVADIEEQLSALRAEIRLRSDR